MLLSKRQVAERLGVTERTVDLWIARGLIDRPIKLGAAQQSRVRFPADTVDNVARRLAAETLRLPRLDSCQPDTSLRLGTDIDLQTQSTRKA